MAFAFGAAELSLHTDTVPISDFFFFFWSKNMLVFNWEHVGAV